MKNQRAAHMLGLVCPGGFPANLLTYLSECSIYVSACDEATRISPHLLNTDAEMERLFDALHTVIR
jgi:selenocysteine lyase/cysteine desulfurase